MAKDSPEPAVVDLPELPCLSAEPHVPRADRDFLHHCLGCLAYHERASFLAGTHPAWRQIKKRELATLQHEQGQSVDGNPAISAEDDAELEAKAERVINKKISSARSSVNSYRKRAATLRAALSTPQDAEAADPAGPQALTRQLERDVTQGFKDWRASDVYLKGIAKVRTWRGAPAAEPEPLPRPGEYSVLRDIKIYAIIYKQSVGAPVAAQTQNGKDHSSSTGDSAVPFALSSAFSSENTYSPTGASEGEPSSRAGEYEPFTVTGEGWKGQFPDQSVSMESVLLPRTGLPEALRRAPGDLSKLRYFHIPLNNMSWIEQIIASYYREPTPDLAAHVAGNPRMRSKSAMLLRPEFWRGQQHGSANAPIHARHLRPLCETVSSNANEAESMPTNVVLFMPYLHWERSREHEAVARLINDEVERQRWRRLAAHLEDKERRQEHRKPLGGGLAVVDHPDEHDLEKEHRIMTGMNTRITNKDDVKSLILKSAGASSASSQTAVADQPTPDAAGSTSRRPTRVQSNANGNKPIGWRQRKSELLAQHSHQSARTFTELLPPDKKQYGSTKPGALGPLLIKVAKLHQVMMLYRDKCLIEDYLYYDPPLHPRRTLDQAYNWTLRTTKARDKRQVVYRSTHLPLKDVHTFDPVDQKPKKPKQWRSAGNGQTHCEGDCERKWSGHWVLTDTVGCEVCRNNMRRTSRLIMVDQLWMWVLDENTLITSFPRRYGFNKSDLSGCHRRIRVRFKNARKNQIRTIWDMALIVLDECLNTFFYNVEPQDLQPQAMDMFAEAIGTVTNKQNILFQHLWDWTERAAKAYRTRATQTSYLLLIDINPESELQREIKGIIDELDIMIHIIKQQREVFKRFCKNVERILAPNAHTARLGDGGDRESDKRRSAASNNGQGLRAELEAIKRFLFREDWPPSLDWFEYQASDITEGFADHIEALEGLKTSAQSTAESVANLLALKQQQAGVVQAYQGMMQGEETVRQGRAIVVFTIVTIVFLPLSFLSSIFGMNNSYFSGGNMELIEQVQIMFPISAGITGVVIIIAFSNFVRTGIWAIFRLASVWLSTHTGFYRFWLNVREDYGSDRLNKRVLKQVNELKDEVVRVRRQKEKERRKRRAAADKREQEGEALGHLKVENSRVAEATQSSSSDGASLRPFDGLRKRMKGLLRGSAAQNASVPTISQEHAEQVQHPRAMPPSSTQDVGHTSTHLAPPPRNMRPQRSYSPASTASGASGQERRASNGTGLAWDSQTYAMQTMKSGPSRATTLVSGTSDAGHMA